MSFWPSVNKPAPKKGQKKQKQKKNYAYIFHRFKLYTT